MNRGFLYGDGFFETIRVTKNFVPLLEYHVKRIHEALEIYQLEPEFEVDESFIEEICLGYKEPEAIVRINFFRDGDGKYLPNQKNVAFNHTGRKANQAFNLPRDLDIFKDLVNIPFEKGTWSVLEEPKPTNPIFRVKSLSSAFYVIASLEKKKKGCKYLFLQNSRNEIVEELSSNLLFLKGDTLYTPKLDSGAVVGATLRYILATYSGETFEANITEGIIASYDAIYICKGTTGITRIA